MQQCCGQSNTLQKTNNTNNAHVIQRGVGNKTKTTMTNERFTPMVYSTEKQKWLYIEDFATFGDFIWETMRTVFDKFENFPECINPAEKPLTKEKFELVKAYAEIEEDLKDAFDAYMQLRPFKDGAKIDEYVDMFRESYVGCYLSKSEFTSQYVEERLGRRSSNWLMSYFDYDALEAELFSIDYAFINGFVFR